MSFAPPEHSSRVFETEGLIIGGPGSVVVVVGQSTHKVVGLYPNVSNHLLKRIRSCRCFVSPSNVLSFGTLTGCHF